MKRLHLFEWEDLPWFPDNFREYITDLLQYQLTAFDVYAPIIGKINKIMDVTESNRLIDVCSGASGPMLSVSEDLAKNRASDFRITLTDKYPNLNAFKNISEKSQGKIDFIQESVDVLDFPQELKGVRTFFSSFHHFKPQQAKQILQAMVDDGMPICIFEFTERSIANFLKVIFFGFFLVWLNTPFIRPYRFGRFFWTYIIPIVPITYCWDALVSHLRTYTIEEVQQMLNLIDESQNYKWEIGKVASQKSRFNITYVVGMKK